MDYKYNELEYAKKILEHGFQSPQHLPTELRLVATYMRRILNYKPKELKEEFYKWCELHIDGYNRVLYYKTINCAINKAIKKGSCLIAVESVKIYQDELDYIINSSIVDHDNHKYIYSYDCQKLMFTFLVRSKLNKQLFDKKNTDGKREYKGISFCGSQKQYTELKKIAKLPQKLKISEDIIHYLYLSKLVTPLNSGILRLDYIKDIYKKINNNGKTPVLVIDEFDKIGWYFDLFNSDNSIKKCEECGCLINSRSKTKPPKYCNECAIEIDRQKAKDRMAKIRNK